MNRIVVRNTRPGDHAGIIEIANRLYADGHPWNEGQLESLLRLFPEGQFVAVDENDAVVGMSANLILRWDDYHFDADWHGHTNHGTFCNHDPRSGRTLYGAEVMVHPQQQDLYTGFKLCDARRQLALRRKLLRIRAVAPLRGYRHFKGELSPNAYLERVLRGRLEDRALSLQLRAGFEVMALLPWYLPHDPENLGCAALIEWRNPAWSPEDVRLMRARLGPDYVFRNSMQHARSVRKNKAVAGAQTNELVECGE